MHQYLRSTRHNSSVKPPFKIFSYERQKPVLSILAASWLLGSQLPQTWRHNSSKTVEQPLPLGFRGTASAKPWPLRSAKWFYLPKPQRWFLKSLTNDTSSYPEHLNYCKRSYRGKHQDQGAALHKGVPAGIHGARSPEMDTHTQRHALSPSCQELFHICLSFLHPFFKRNGSTLTYDDPIYLSSFVSLHHPNSFLSTFKFPIFPPVLGSFPSSSCRAHTGTAPY